MMLSKKTKELIFLKARVKELEELICPCEQHDLIKTHCMEPLDATGLFRYKYICKKCKKVVWMFD